VKGLIGEVLIGVIYLAIVYSLVRPQSPAASVIKTVSNALIGIVGTVTGYTQVGGLTLG
jgi:xanthosine utilization system XapX-like protein